MNAAFDAGAVAAEAVARAMAGPDPGLIANPDMNVLRLHRRPPPLLPLALFGDNWHRWIGETADAAGCPPDYVVAPLLATVSGMIGNARWVQATPGWEEPPHLWIGSVGDSGTNKSPGSDCLFREVLPAIERRMEADFPERLREHQAAAEIAKARREEWGKEVREANKNGKAPPLPPAAMPSEPQCPRLRQNDVTIEKIACLLATAAPKGLVIVRDELIGWLGGMNNYHDAGRAFWVEAYGGRPYRVERQKHPLPIVVPRLAVSVYGTTQPDKLAPFLQDADDGLLARVIWVWPDPIPFRLGRQAPQSAWAIAALDRLRLLDLAPGAKPNDPSHPVLVSLSGDVLPLLETFARIMQTQQNMAGGLLRSAYGKARGLALRLSLVLEMLWWCGSEGMSPPPTKISSQAFAAAADVVAKYFMPNAERVYGDACVDVRDRNAATLARWIFREKATEVHVRRLQRETRLPGLTSAEVIHAAAAVLIDAGWLEQPERESRAGRPRVAYQVNPRILELANGQPG